MMTPTQEPKTSPRNRRLLLLFGCFTLIICGLCALLLGVGGFAVWQYQQDLAAVDTPTAVSVATLQPATATPSTTTGETAVPPTPIVADADATPIPVTLTPVQTLAVIAPPEINQEMPPPRSTADLAQLLNTNYPPQDYFETAVRLGNHELSARTVQGPQYAVGDIRTYYTDDGPATAVLMAITEHTYFWVDDRLDYRTQDIETAAARLEAEYYPQLVSLFGREWQPGIDNDPRFSIVHLSGDADGSELGYFSDVDEYPQALYSDSNEQEAVYLIMGPLELGSDLYYGTMVHEIQHLIQWYLDPNESTWMDEGLAQLAEIYVGLETADTYDYLYRPDIHLNRWDYEENTDAHYAGSYLFSVYLWEQLGEKAIQELARHPANGMASVNAVLQGYAPERPLTDFFADWAVANYLDDPAAGPPYYYRRLDFRRPSFELQLDEPQADFIRQLNQFGVHYIEMDYRGPSTVTFVGDSAATLIDSPPPHGAQFWLAPAVNNANMHLTAAFDLTNLDSATLNFATWYHLEKDYDYAYLTASLDGGETWELLSPQHASPGEFGPAFNGRSADEADAVDGWLKESVSLDRYTGHTVMLRFEVLTDSAILGRGFAVDDLAIPELGYKSDVENESDGWQANGFVQTGWLLPQQWEAQLITDGPQPQVTQLPLNAYNQGQWHLDIGKGGGILVLTPLTPFIAEPAQYWLHITD